MNSGLLSSASDRRCNDWLHVHACLLRLHYFLAHGSNMGHMQNLDMQLDGGSMTKFEQALYIFRLSGRESPCQKGDKEAYIIFRQEVYGVTFLDLKQEESCMKKIEQPKKQNNHPLGTQQKLLVVIILFLCAAPALFLHERVLLRSTQLG